ncbi:hypothetical protein JRI60_15445 [Archangium violaceum]|uniref:DUF6249 domain-containing protein n=1 Tax=Archangium violaceum TaxID=83451 RepID=UPI0019527BB3|nr:DUF6249 domain-containing protein [Archangium violaceum]QRO00318.1 hypothetical protein JRI60_15445 [Archangium violaceum]
MKVQLLTLCLLATLAGEARAQATPESETPAAPSTPPGAPVPASPRLEAQRQALEARRAALDAQRQALEEDIQQLEEQARRIDPEGRLSSDQLFELLQARERAQRPDADFDPGPYIVSVCFFTCLLTGFLAWLVANNRKNHQLHQTVRMMVEKGAEIPPGLLAPPPRRKPSDLRRGIILSTTGVGLTIFLAALPHSDGAWGVGVTLLLIGVGHMLVWRLQRGRGPLASELSPEPQL